MRAALALPLVLLAAPVAAQTDAVPGPECGEPCTLSKTLKELRALPPLPVKDPMPGEEFEPPVKAYSDCTVQAFHEGGGDWAAPADETDAVLKQSAAQCVSKRIDAQALFIEYFEKNSPALTTDQKRVYGSYVIGMHGMMMLNRDAEKDGKLDKARAYLLSRVTKDDFSFGLLYFDVGD